MDEEALRMDVVCCFQPLFGFSIIHDLQMACTVMDDSCGMLINLLQHNIGLEYEYRLHEVHAACAA